VGSPVAEQTVKALLTDEAMNRFERSAYRFCAESSCFVVYFGENGRVFGTSDVRVIVWQKAPSGARMICYCFGEREDEIRGELRHAGCSRAIERVRARIAERRCACEIRNPRGACCLGELMAAVERVSDRITHEREREGVADR
jgi:hypothetical protein